jgi:hypothetical protein
VAASTIRTTIKRFQAAGLNWPLPEDMTDAALEVCGITCWDRPQNSFAAVETYRSARLRFWERAEVKSLRATRQTEKASH